MTEHTNVSPEQNRQRVIDAARKHPLVLLLSVDEDGTLCLARATSPRLNEAVSEEGVEFMGFMVGLIQFAVHSAFGEPDRVSHGYHPS